MPLFPCAIFANFMDQPSSSARKRFTARNQVLTLIQQNLTPGMMMTVSPAVETSVRSDVIPRTLLNLTPRLHQPVLAVENRRFQISVRLVFIFLLFKTDLI